MESMKKRILYITPFGGMNMGGQVSLFHLINNLSTKLYTPLLVTSNEGELSDKIKKMGHQVFYRSFGTIKPKRIFNIISDIAWLIKLVKREKIVLIHTDHARDTFHSVFVSLLIGVPIIWHVRVTTPNRPLDMLNKLIVRKIIGISNAVNDRFIGPFYKHDKFIRIFNGVDFKNFNIEEKIISNLKEKLCMGKDVLIVTSGTQIVKGKGVDDFIHSAAQLLAEGIKAIFLIIGEGSIDDWNRVKNLISTLNVSKGVILLGYRKDVPAILMSSDIVVIASHENFEGGCPRLALEAMVAGKPLVVTNIRGMNEIVNNNSALFVPEQSPELMAYSIKLLLQDKELRIKLGNEAKKVASEILDIKVNASRVEKLYESLLTA